MEVLYHNEINIKSSGKAFDQTVELLRKGAFAAAEVKKLPGTGYYRAKLDYSTRLLFRFGKYDGKTHLLLLEVIRNHDYGKSRFLRGVAVDESKLLPLHDASAADKDQVVHLPYVHPQHRHFHYLGKIISFDADQAELLHLPPPLIIIGSAGSGKTALALEKIKFLKGNILYVTLSPHLAEHAANLYHSGHYENEAQETDFLSFREFVESIRVPEGQKVGFREFEQWFLPHRHHSAIKDAHKLFEEFNGVLSGHSVEKEFMDREEYVSLGVRQSIFPEHERHRVYDLFEKYLKFLDEKGYYDLSMIAHRWLQFCRPAYDFIIADEVQDYTNSQLFLVMRALKKPGNFVLCGDANQIVHPNYFSWSRIKTMFHDHLPQGNITRILTTNYRNSPQVTETANRILKIKHARFGSVDRESTYLIRSVASAPGEVSLLDDTEQMKAEFDSKTRQSARFAVIVMRTEDKAAAAKYFKTPLIFTVQEAKGLEYENILLWNFISGNAQPFRDIASGISMDAVNVDELTYSRAGDKTDKSLEAYKFFINALFVGVTRCTRNLYIVERDHRHEMPALLGLTVSVRQINLARQVSSREEWQREARKLEKQGRKEQAELIHRTILGTMPVPWRVLTHETLSALKKEALDPASFNKKSKDTLFHYALIYNESDIGLELSRMKYRRAELFDSERRSLLRRIFTDYAADSPNRIMPLVNKYGVDFRNEFNQTPLMIAVWTGSLRIAEHLLALGANTELCDNLGKNALRTALLQTMLSPEYSGAKLGGIYPLAVTAGLNVRAENRLVKIGNHRTEYLLLNLLMAIHKDLIRTGNIGSSVGFTSGEIAAILEKYPENALPSYRKRQHYISSVLSRNETSRKEPHNKMLFLRMERGRYVINPELDILADDRWVNIYAMMQTEKITPERNAGMVLTALENQLTTLKTARLGLMDKMAEEVEKSHWGSSKLDETEEEVKAIRRKIAHTERRIREARQLLPPR